MVTSHLTAGLDLHEVSRSRQLLSPLRPLCTLDNAEA